MKNIQYKYGHMSIPGGGYVTGFAYHPACKNLLYCRTDIGGVYRYDYDNDTWISLMDHVTHINPAECYPSAIALDPHNPAMLYIACGLSDWRRKPGVNGIFAVSDDYGKTFRYSELPCVVHGNFPGRGCGMRLVVDYNNPDVLYFASQRGGLLRTSDGGMTWQSISIAAGSRANELNCTFVWVHPDSGTLVLGTAGINNKSSDGLTRGHSLYVSYDTGGTWEELPMPDCLVPDGARMKGYTAERYDYDGRYLYVTLSCNGPKSQIDDEGYSCDSGDAAGGKILRYPVDQSGHLGSYNDITPCGGPYSYSRDRANECGFGGICSSPQVPGLLAASTLSEKRGDIVFISRDYGDTWEVNLHKLDNNRIYFNTSYMKPEFNGNTSLIHWLSDIKINPFDYNDVIFNTGTGVFGTYNFTSDDCKWCDRCPGIEETVHINVYSPHAGDVIAIDAVGDLGGFAFTKTDTPCTNSFADADGNRYITCINADYTDNNPNRVVVTARGNWTGMTTGGLILSNDQCRTFTHLDLPFGIDEYTDTLLHRISMVNQNAGWVTITADGNSIIWTPADRVFLPLVAVLVSHDCGRTFRHSVFYDADGNILTDGFAKVYADRVNPEIVYAFDTTRKIYISHDTGDTFIQYPVPDDVPECILNLIDTMDKSSLCIERGRTGTFYMALGVDGIWKMQYNITNDKITFKKITDGNKTFYRIGLGIGPDGDFLRGLKSIYAAAIIDGVYGFYRSDDDGASWLRINNDNQMFGQIDCICGDARSFGRFYIATGSRGLLYGEPIQ